MYGPTTPHEVKRIGLERQILDGSLVELDALADRILGESVPIELKQMFTGVGGVDAAI
jgi:hypothetical protein